MKSVSYLPLDLKRKKRVAVVFSIVTYITHTFQKLYIKLYIVFQSPQGMIYMSFREFAVAEFIVNIRAYNFDFSN